MLYCHLQFQGISVPVLGHGTVQVSYETAPETKLYVLAEKPANPFATDNALAFAHQPMDSLK